MVEKKKKFEYMSTNEWLCDPTTHFMKSGESLRSPDNDDLQKLAAAIPRIANGVKVEYDISFDIPGRQICGYKVTDLLTKCVYITPQSSRISRENIATVASWGPTNEGHEVVAKLRQGLTDKYIQTNDDMLPVAPFADLVVLPGTNVLVKEGAVDIEKIDTLVKAGALVKLHPITSKVWQTMLKGRWGDAVLPADAPLYKYVRACERVHFTMSSETGISSVLLGKKIGLINGPKAGSSNFEAIYRGIDTCPEKMTLTDKLTALFSHPESGLLTVYHADPEARVAAFFEHFARNFEHKQ